MQGRPDVGPLSKKDRAAMGLPPEAEETPQPARGEPREAVTDNPRERFMRGDFIPGDKVRVRRGEDELVEDPQLWEVLRSPVEGRVLIRKGDSTKNPRVEKLIAWQRLAAGSIRELFV